MGFLDEREKKLKNRSNLGANNQSVFFLILLQKINIGIPDIKLCSIYIFLVEIGLRSNFSLKMSEI